MSDSLSYCLYVVSCIDDTALSKIKKREIHSILMHIIIITNTWPRSNWKSLVKCWTTTWSVWFIPIRQGRSSERSGVETNSKTDI